jgi:hypothetical protein
MQSLTSFFIEEPEASDDNTRRYIDKLSRILQTRNFAEKKRQTMTPPRSTSAFGARVDHPAKPSIFSEFLRTNDKLPPAPAKYKSIQALRAQSADGRKNERVQITPWSNDTDVNGKFPEQVIYELQQTQKLMWPVDSEKWQIFKTDTTSLNPNAFKRTLSLMHTIVNLQDNADKNRRQVLREISAVLYFCEFAGLKFGSINNILGHLCLFIDKEDYMMDSPIEETAFVSFCRSNGFEREPATLVFGLVKKELGKADIHTNDFMCLFKYLDKSILEIHRWSAETKLLFPYTEIVFFRPPRMHPKTFKPVTIWLFNASPSHGMRGFRFHVQKDLQDIRKLHAEIKRTCPQVVPFSANVYGIFDSALRCKITSYMQLKPEGCYVVAGALQPIWQNIIPKIQTFV